MKKGQVTIFVIIGIVILVVLIFALAARDWIESTSDANQAQKVLDEALHDEVLSNYVSGCVERVAENGIKQMLLQGGRLYNTSKQKGPLDTTNLVEGVHYLKFNYSNQTINVSYGILPNDQCEDVYLDPPLYPRPGPVPGPPTEFFACANSNRDSDGYYGLHNLTRLCERDGPNRITQDYTDVGTTCYVRYDQMFDELSIQSQMEYYIEEHLPNCTNFTGFNLRYGEVTAVNRPEVTFVYGTSTVAITATYPFFVDINSKRITRYNNFNADIKLNVKGLYACAWRLVGRDVMNVDYNKTSQFGEEDVCQGLIYREYRNANPENDNTSFDDIIEIIDPHSEIEGVPLSILFAVINRRPALDWIRDPTNYGLPLGYYDIQVLENDTIVFNPWGHDPDELSVWYNYSMWREDYVEQFNWTCCDPYGPINCTLDVSPCMTKNTTFRPESWTNSTLFTSTKRNASYETSRQDVGYHIVNVSTWDREGLVDYQEVKVLVFDRPDAKINQSNFYEDIGDNFASIEDPYLLSGNLSRVSTLLGGGQIGYYYWNDTIEFFINTTHSDSILPNQSYSINNSAPDRITLFNFSVLGLHNITLIVWQNSSIGMIHSHPDYTNVTVLACLPHRSNNHPWPYNDIDWGGFTPIADEFQANHTCCSDGSDGLLPGEIRPDNVECFNYVSYGQLYAFENMTDQPTKQFAPVPDLYIYLNDIFKREFGRNCSGLRGNTCEGDASDKYVMHQECTEGGLIGDAETCSGPTSQVEEEFPDDIVCQNYAPWESFEKDFGLTKKISLEPADGQCFELMKCADMEGGTFANIGSYNLQCNATCSGGGCNNPTQCVCAYNQDDYELTCGTSTSQLCDHKPTGEAWPSSGSVEWDLGCDSNCNLLDCTPYTFDTGNKNCFNRHDWANACDDGFQYDTDSGRCVGGVYGSRKETTGNFDSYRQCEDLFMADPTDYPCDEQHAGNCQITGKRCDFNCRYVDDVTCP